MKMKPQAKIAFLRAKASPGFTLIELMITVVISVFVIASILTLVVISMQNYVATANYVRMNDQSRNVMDHISREIRNASIFVSATPNTSLVLINTNNNATISITYNSSAQTLTLTTNQVTLATLTSCSNFTFQLYDHRTATTNDSFSNQTTDLNACKAISLSWICQQHITGSKLSTQIAQAAQVMLRNK
jgi:Tfp pilus assembly protein PilW